jgi:hypothetical protein
LDAGEPVDRGIPKCSNCDQLGHISKSCPEEKQENADRAEVKCFNCDEVGHRVRDCGSTSSLYIESKLIFKAPTLVPTSLHAVTASSPDIRARSAQSLVPRRVLNARSVVRVCFCLKIRVTQLVQAMWNRNRSSHLSGWNPNFLHNLSDYDFI